MRINLSALADYCICMAPCMQNMPCLRCWMPWQALELIRGQEARIDVEGAEHGYTFIFNHYASAGWLSGTLQCCHSRPCASVPAVSAQHSSIFAVCLDACMPHASKLHASAQRVWLYFCCQPHGQMCDTCPGGIQKDLDKGPSRKKARLSEGPELQDMPAAENLTEPAPAGVSPAIGPPPAFSLLRVRGLCQEHSW